MPRPVQTRLRHGQHVHACPPSHACMHACAHTHTHTCVCLASQLSEAAEAHEANVATLKARVEYYQQAAVEAGREAEELRHRWGKV